jgi:hypothetical protein
MKVACFFSLVACIAGFGFFDGEGTQVAEDAGVGFGGGGGGDARPAPAPAPAVDPNETCESKIARGADLTCSACCPNECAKFEDTDVADAYKTLNDADADFSTYTYDFRGHDGCVCFNDKSYNSDYGSVHLTEGNDCALVVSSADVHGLGGDDTLIVESFWGNGKIYGGAGDDHVKVLYGTVDATRVEGGEGQDSVVIYEGGAIVDGDVETLTSYGGECAETGEEPGERRCEYDYDYDYDYYDDQIETGTCLEEWSDDADDGCTDQQNGCPAVACDGDEKPWCSAVGGGWFYCDPYTGGPSI